MQHILKQVFVVALLSIAVVVVQIFAFTEPAIAPPGGNVSPPINTGSGDQTKLGGFGIGGGSGQPVQLLKNIAGTLHIKNAVDTSSVSVGQDGNVGVGTQSPTAKLEVNGIVKTTDLCLLNTSKCLSNLPKIIIGTVDPYGFVERGVGFTSSFSSSKYTITFVVPMPSTPSVIVIPEISSGLRYAVVNSATTGGFSVTIWDDNSIQTSQATFSFIAIAKTDW